MWIMSNLSISTSWTKIFITQLMIINACQQYWQSIIEMYIYRDFSPESCVKVMCLPTHDGSRVFVPIQGS